MEDQELSILWTVPTSEGHSISDTFRPEELAAALRRLKPGVSGSGFHLPGVYIPHRIGSQILVLCFPHFVHAPTQNSKDLQKSTNSCDLSRKCYQGTQRATALYLCCVPPLQSSRDSSTPVLNQSSTHCSHRSRRAVDTGGRP